MIFYIALFVAVQVAALAAFYFGAKKGREKEKSESIKTTVKEALDVKKDNEARLVDSIDIVDERLLKLARKE